MRSVRAIVALAILATVLVLPLTRADARPAGDPALSVPPSDLEASLHCPAAFTGAGQGEPVLLVHGTGSTGEETW